LTENKTDSVLNIIIPIVAWIGFIYHMVMTHVLLMTSVEHQAVHLGFMLSMVFLTTMKESRSTMIRLVLLFVIVIGLFATGYVKVFYELLEESIGFPENMDIFVGFLLLGIVIVGSWVAFGPVFPIMTIVCVLYFFLGHLLPNPLYHPPISIPYGISCLNIGLSGLFGNLLGIVANYGVLLLIFGALLETGGANTFFFEVGKAAGRILAGGPAQTAIIGSSMVGMVSGGAISNVMITGSVTIPMMKRVGYRPETAGAIEATASTGGQFMPPIMGIAAFLMAGFLGIPYVEIMRAGLVPALIYYFVVAVNVQLLAKKRQITPPGEKIDKTLLLHNAPTFIIPLFFLITFLLMQKSLGFTSFYAILLLLLLAHIRKSTRPSFSKLTQGIVKGFTSAARISLVVGAVAMLTQVFITTGLAQKISAVVTMISGGLLVPTLFFTMLLCILLGCGLPTSAAYALVAILIAPSLIQMGLNEISAHFFVFYFAIVAAVTPPIALASMAAASIAGSDFWKTGLEAFKMSLPGFILPFLFVFNPILLLQSMDRMIGLAVLISVMVSLVLLSSAIYGYFIKDLVVIERIWQIIPAAFLFGFAFSHHYSLFFIGLAIFVFDIFRQLNYKKREISGAPAPVPDIQR